jgi:SAM-dependent methyltransferase
MDVVLRQPAREQVELLSSFAAPESIQGALDRCGPTDPRAERAFLEELVRQQALVPVASAAERAGEPTLSGCRVAVCCQDAELAGALRAVLQAAEARLEDSPDDADWTIADDALELSGGQRGLFVRVTDNSFQLGPCFAGSFVPDWLPLVPAWAGSRRSLVSLASELAVAELRNLVTGVATHAEHGALHFDLAQLQFTFVRSAPAARPATDGDAFSGIAELYQRERSRKSVNALVVDPYLEELARGLSPARILDVGAGSGEAAAIFARCGHHVLAVEPSPAMAEAALRLAQQVTPGRIEVVRGTAEDAPLGAELDLVLLNMVLDHIEDCGQVLRRCHRALRPGGQLIVVLPHPLKDSGYWEERFVAGERRYPALRVTSYFQEGRISKARYAEDGSVAIAEVRSFKRNPPFYFAELCRAGFSVTGMHEPQPPPNERASAHFSKASQVPYALIFEGRKGDLPP